MVKLQLKNKTGKPYAELRDELCRALVGNRAFIENDIIVSDHSIDAETGEVAYDNQANNEIMVLLGDTKRPDGTDSPLVELEGELY